MVNFCEFDKYAAKSYCAIHGTSETLNLGDITKVDEREIEPFNMICGGSPCQDFSLAGKQAGAVWKCRSCGYEYNPLQVHYSKRDACGMCGSHDIDKTRSSLLVEWLRMIRGVKPVWGIIRNPLSCIKTSCFLINSLAEKENIQSEKLREYLQIMEKAAEDIESALK